MYRGIKIAAVVPAHNEENHIKEVIVTMPEIVDVIAITDDTSSDSTFDIASSTGDERVFVTRHEVNTGVGGAILTAHEVAKNQGSQINAVFAGDGQMDPNYLTKLLDPVVDGLYGYTKGNRLFSRNSHSGMPKYRIFGNYVLSYMHKAVGGYWNVTDPQNGYTALRVDLLDEIDYLTISKGYEFENDMLTRLNEHNIPVLDVPIPAVYRDEVSGISLKKVIPALLKNFTVSYAKRLFRKYVKQKVVLPTLFMAIGAISLTALVAGISSLNPGLVGAAAFGFALSVVCLSIYDFLKVPKPWNPPRSMS